MFAFVTATMIKKIFDLDMYNGIMLDSVKMLLASIVL